MPGSTEEPRTPRELPDQAGVQGEARMADQAATRYTEAVTATSKSRQWRHRSIQPSWTRNSQLWNLSRKRRKDGKPLGPSRGLERPSPKSEGARDVWQQNATHPVQAQAAEWHTWDKSKTCGAKSLPDRTKHRHWSGHSTWISYPPSQIHRPGTTSKERSETPRVARHLRVDTTSAIGNPWNSDRWDTWWATTWTQAHWQRSSTSVMWAVCGQNVPNRSRNKPAGVTWKPSCWTRVKGNLRSRVSVASPRHQPHTERPKKHKSPKAGKSEHPWWSARDQHIANQGQIPGGQASGSWHLLCPKTTPILSFAATQSKHCHQREHWKLHGGFLAMQTVRTAQQSQVPASHHQPTSLSPWTAHGWPMWSQPGTWGTASAAGSSRGTPRGHRAPGPQRGGAHDRWDTSHKCHRWSWESAQGCWNLHHPRSSCPSLASKTTLAVVQLLPEVFQLSNATPNCAVRELLANSLNAPQLTRMMQDTNASERIDMDLGTGDRFQMATDASPNPRRMQGAYFFQPAGRLVRTAFPLEGIGGMDKLPKEPCKATKRQLLCLATPTSSRRHAASVTRKSNTFCKTSRHARMYCLEAGGPTRTIKHGHCIRWHVWTTAGNVLAISLRAVGKGPKMLCL